MFEQPSGWSITPGLLNFSVNETAQQQKKEEYTSAKYYQICICAYLTYNISMVVKRKSPQIDRIRKILNDQNGILLTSDLARVGIPRTYLSIMVLKGEIRRISRGVYSAANVLLDDMVSLQARFKGAIFSHETALFLLGLTDRTPLFYSVTVKTGYNASRLKESGARVYYVKRTLYSIGLITLKSPHGNDIKTFNLERTVCDILRSRNQIEIQFITEALKRYVNNKDKDLNRLYLYAAQFRIQKIVREYLEVLL